MRTDSIESQLAAYGSLLRERLDQVPPTTRPTSSPPHGAADLTVRRELKQRRRPSGSTLLRVAAVIGPIIALVAGLMALRREPDQLDATPIASPTEIERRDTDTDAFIQALDDVDFELTATGQREPTDQERQQIQAEFAVREGDVIDDSVTIVQELTGGLAVIQFDVVPTPDDDLGNGIITDRCQFVAQTSPDGLSNIARNGYSCFDPDFDQFASRGIEYGFSYGCQPAYSFPGGSFFGKRNFEVIVNVVADSPGVIFTLDNGDNVLSRPIDGMVFYGGSPAKQMTIYTPNGAITVNTDDCL